MKNIITIVTVLFSLSLAAQSKKDVYQRTEATEYHSKARMKDNGLTDPAEGYAIFKMSGVTESGMTVSEADKIKFTEMFKKQYPVLMAASEKYKENKSAQAKVELFTVLVNNEEEFRNSLTRDQLAEYIAFAENHSKSQNWQFFHNFMSAKDLAKYKEEIQ